MLARSLVRSLSFLSIVVDFFGEVCLRYDFFHEHLRFFQPVVLHAELLDRWRDVFNVHDSLLQDRLQENDHNSNLSVFLQNSHSNRAALLHAVLNEQERELFGEVDVLLDAVEDLNFGERQAHLIQYVVVFGDLVAVGHVDEEFHGDLRVINHEVWQLGRAHVNVKHHLFVRL